jgi:hypothetical protein
MFCETCGANNQAGKFCGKCGSSLSPAQEMPHAQNVVAVSAGPSPRSSSQKVEYMVLTQKDRVFGGKFNPVQLQEALNGFAQQGWRVIEAATTSFPGMTGSREELVFILERELRS